MKDRFPAVDGLRGLAVLLVTVLHLWSRAGQRPFALGSLDLGVLTPLIMTGAYAVSLFFTVSGFCLFYPLARATVTGRPWPRWSNFYERRAIRILPAYWVALAVWLPLWLANSGISGSPLDSPDWWRQVWSHLTFTHNFSDQTVMGIDFVLWSLGTEIHFYLLFPLLALALKRWRHWFLLAAFAFTVVLRYVLSAQGHYAMAWQFSLPCRLMDFVLGMYIAQLFAGRPQEYESDELPPWLTATGFVGIVGLLAFPYVHQPLWKLTYQPGQMWWWGDALFMPCWGALLLLALFAEQGKNIFSWRPLALLGLISYSVYLYNPLVNWFDAWLQPVLGGYLFPLGVLGGAAYQGLIFVLVTGVGCIGYLAVERPFLGLRARLRARSTAVDASPAKPR